MLYRIIIRLECFWGKCFYKTSGLTGCLCHILLCCLSGFLMGPSEGFGVSLSNRHVLTISYLLQSTHSTQQDTLWYLVGIGNSTNCLEGWDSSWLVPLQMMANLSGCKPVNSEALMYCIWDKHEEEILAINNMGRIMWFRGWDYGTTSSYYSKQISLLLHLGAFSVLGAKQTAR